MSERPWADWNKGKGLSAAQLAKQLRDFGSSSGPGGLHTRDTWITIVEKDAKGIETKTNKTVKRWHREDFSDAWSRYASSEPARPRDPNNDGPQPPKSNPRGTPPLAALIDEKSGDATAPVDRSKGTPGWDPTRARPVIGRTEGSDELY
jgi:hypothetical protein